MTPVAPAAERPELNRIRGSNDSSVVGATMKRFGIVLLAALGLASLANAADLPTAKAPEQLKSPPNCWGNLWDILKTSASDCPLTYAGF